MNTYGGYMSKRKSPTPNDKKIIKASPTKEFFISMLIKDIILIDAIGDLIDNAVDGAKRNGGRGDLSNFFINITLNKSKFEIKDNCGGIDIDVARKYAFRFGRPTEYKMETHSIGQFGIGMKRAFFKIGNKIDIKSTSINSTFTTTIEVKKWQKDKDNWDFSFTSFRENLRNVPLNKRGTVISITDLREESNENFGLGNFTKLLNLEIAKEHLYSINKGLKIKINGYFIKPPKLTLIYDREFKPAYWKHRFNGLSVEVLSGVAEDDGEKGGWYIFCNERLITGPNTTAETGWTGRGAGGVALYHDQFYRFRGYVFFNSDDPSKLPWKTTKTGIDKDSTKYNYVKTKMIGMMRPVMTLMNQLKKEKEKDKPESERLLNNKIERAKILSLFEVLKHKRTLPDSFVYPAIKMKQPKHGQGTIKYTKPFSQIDQIKKKLHVIKLESVGSKTFNYYYENEIG